MGSRPFAALTIHGQKVPQSSDITSVGAQLSRRQRLRAGKLSERLRESVEAVDLFVGRYLLIWTVAYVGFKFVHFKIFDPFPM